MALEKANNPDQARFFPYLTGYVAFYGGDYKTAITELEKASQDDPFILVLLAQSYEKAGDAARAKEYYGKVMANNGHNPTECICAPAGEEETGGRVGPIVLWPLYLALAQEYWVGTKPARASLNAEKAHARASVCDSTHPFSDTVFPSRKSSRILRLRSTRSDSTETSLFSGIGRAEATDSRMAFASAFPPTLARYSFPIASALAFSVKT